MSINNLKEERKKFVEYVKGDLIGKKIKDDTLNSIYPLERYFTGMLFPITEMLEHEDSEEYDSQSEEGEKQEAQSLQKTKHYMPPSSAGFSFFIKGDEIKLRTFYQAVIYEKNDDDGEEVEFNKNDNKEYKNENNNKKNSWKRIELANDDGEEVEFNKNDNKEYKVLQDRAKISALWRKHEDGFIVTISLSNDKKLGNEIHTGEKYNEEINEKSLFEVVLKCIVEKGEVADYPATETALLDKEEREIELRYQDIKIYAVGHGVSVDWKKNKQSQMEIWSDFMPQVEVPQVTADTGDKHKKHYPLHFWHKKTKIKLLTHYRSLLLIIANG